VPASARHLYLHLCLHLHLSIRENLRPRVSPFAPPGSYASTYVCTPAYACHRTAPAVRVRLQFAPATAPSALHLPCTCACSLRRRLHPPPCTCARQTPAPAPAPAQHRKLLPPLRRHPITAEISTVPLQQEPACRYRHKEAHQHHLGETTVRFSRRGSAAGRRVAPVHLKRPTTPPSHDLPVHPTRTAPTGKGRAGRCFT